MRPSFTFFTRNKIATAATAAALSVVTTMTLVAGGMLVSRVIDFGGDRNVAALPTTDEPLGPILVEGKRIERVPSGSIASSADVSTSPGAKGSARPTRAALLDAPERVTGSISAALDTEKTGRMNEVTTISRIEAILKPPQEEEEQADAAPEDHGTESSEPEESENPTVVRSVEDLTADVQGTVEPPTADVYSVRAAGSASPSA